MLKKYYPKGYVNDVFSIDYEKLLKKGYKGLIFDIDQTLVPHGYDSTKEIDELFKKIHELGIRTILLSNNTKERIERFNKNIKTLYINDAEKPNPSSYKKAIDLLGLKKSECLVIGDQVFTDVKGANAAGIDSLLVKFINETNTKKIGKRRRVEKVILKCYSLNKKNNILEDVNLNRKQKKLFCEMNPLFYSISEKKEIAKRHIKNYKERLNFAINRNNDLLPMIIANEETELIKKGKDIDQTLQHNKAKNIEICCSKIDGLLIKPGEIFSFWKLIGKPTKRKGFKDGRVIINDKIQPGLGGGLCGLANVIHRMVLHSPLEVTEIHHHSDALAPDNGKRIPFSAGTCISYNNLDLRFKNNTNQTYQLHLWCKNDMLYGELRSAEKNKYKYELIEENYHFSKKNDKYYRNSKIYRQVSNPKTNEIIEKKLIWDNHSVVMFDYDLIPKDLIK